jgi:hypothetical protein
MSQDPWALLREARAWMQDHRCEGDDGQCLCNRYDLEYRIDTALAERLEEVKWRKVGGGLASVEVSHIATIGDIAMEVYDLDAPIPVLWEVKSTFAKQGYASTVDEAKDAAIKAARSR